jgi:hypothetical protein
VPAVHHLLPSAHPHVCLLRWFVLQGFAQPVVLVTAKRRSVHRDGPTAGPSKLVYNIGGFDTHMFPESAACACAGRLVGVPDASWCNMIRQTLLSAAGTIARACSLANHPMLAPNAVARPAVLHTLPPHHKHNGACVCVAHSWLLLLLPLAAVAVAFCSAG